MPHFVSISILSEESSLGWDWDLFSRLTAMRGRMFIGASSPAWCLSTKVGRKKLMKISRRDFLLLTAGLTAGCQAVNEAGNSGSAKARAVNAGQPSSYAAAGVYSNVRDLGFFLVRRGDKLFPLSSYCTHRT